MKLNGGRQISGILRGFDPFMNLVVDESVEETKAGDRNGIGMVVGGINKYLERFSVRTVSRHNFFNIFYRTLILWGTGLFMYKL